MRDLNLSSVEREEAPYIFHELLMALVFIIIRFSAYCGPYCKQTCSIVSVSVLWCQGTTISINSTIVEIANQVT
jgi:hypothetical protein